MSDLPELLAETPSGLRTVPVVTRRELHEEFLAQFKSSTQQAYAGDLRRFAAWIGAGTDVRVVLAHLVSLGRSDATRLVKRYAQESRERGLSSATVQRSLSALRALVSLAVELGLCEWELRVRGPKRERVQDRRGPDRATVLSLFALARQRDPLRAVRDVAILSLLYYRALRVNEIVTLDLEHVRLDRSELLVLAKGANDHSERVPITPELVNDMKAWLSLRPKTTSHALFVGAPPAQVAATRQPERLTSRDVRRVLRCYAKASGVSVRPHGLRHAAATHILDAGGTMRDAQALLRHKNLATTSAFYDDTVAQLALDAQRLLWAAT